MKVCVYTRSFYENPYLDAFIEHYCRLGFDKIIILKADGSLNNCSPAYADKVEFKSVANEVNNLIPKYDYLVLKRDYDWVLSCDVDELLLLNKKYKDIHHYITEILKREPAVNAFYFRWAMIEKYNIDTSGCFLLQMLQKYKLYKNMHIKTMMKTSDVERIHDPHICRFSSKCKPHIFFEGQVLNKSCALHPIHANSYQDSMLVHVHTRSLHSIVLKAILTGIEAKAITNVQKFPDIIKATNTSTSDELLKMFKDIIGKKATLPYTHAKGEVVDLAWLQEQFTIPKTSSAVIQHKEELFDIIKVLEQRKINRLDYLGFINKLNEATKKLFTR